MTTEPTREPDSSPPLFGTVGALVASVFAGVAVATTPLEVGLSILGTACVGVGLLYTSQQGVTLGVGVLLLVVLAAGIGSNPVRLVVAGALLSLTWVLASHAVRLAQQIGRGGQTLRVELVHAVTTITVAGASGGGGYVIFRSSGGTASLLAVGLFLASVATVVLLLR